MARTTGLDDKFKFGKYGPKEGNHKSPREVIDAGDWQYLDYLFDNTHHKLSIATWKYYDEYKKANVTVLDGLKI